MQTPSVSVIMPARNSARWIACAIESVLAQQGVRWELLIVDDGSTDATPAIVKRYAFRDKRIRLLANTCGKGVGGARNTALKEARGTAVAFLDSDDMLLPDALLSLYERLQRDNCPMVAGLHAGLCMLRFQISGRAFTADEIAAGRMASSAPPRPLWTHIFDREFLCANGLLFSKEILRCEDTLFLFQAYSLVDGIGILNKHVYLYRKNHKIISYSPDHAVSQLKASLLMQEYLSGKGMAHRLTSYLKNNFFVLWPHYLAILQLRHPELVPKLLRQSIGLFNGQETGIPLTAECLPEKEGVLFHELCREETADELLAFLREREIIRSGFPYEGIERHLTGYRLPLYAVPRKVLNLLRDGYARRLLRYMLVMRLRAMKRRLRNTLG